MHLFPREQELSFFKKKKKTKLFPLGKQFDLGRVMVRLCLRVS